MGKTLPLTIHNSSYLNDGSRLGPLSSSFINIQVTKSPQKTFITLKFLLTFFNTKAIPQTLFFLQTHFPRVFDTKCFNGQELPFAEEVKITELGHLFEHILIRKLYDLRTSAGEENVVISGRTEWDWRKEERGVFNIVVSSGKNDSCFFSQALEETLALMEKLILTSTLNR